jgi:SIT4-associating protein SAP185/190
MRQGLMIRYPQVATEILSSELWTISETIMSNKESLLKPFWDAVLPPIEAVTPSTEDSLAKSKLEQTERERARDEFWSDKDEERDRQREVIRGMWTRVNGTLMTKRTHEVGDLHLVRLNDLTCR